MFEIVQNDASDKHDCITKEQYKTNSQKRAATTKELTQK